MITGAINDGQKRRLLPPNTIYGYPILFEKLAIKVKRDGERMKRGKRYVQKQVACG